MQNTHHLKTNIITIIDTLPLEGLKLLAEFVTFLQEKFKLRPTVQVSPDQMVTVRQEHWQHMGQLLLPVLASVDWAEIEIGR